MKSLKIISADTKNYIKFLFDHLFVQLVDRQKTVQCARLSRRLASMVGMNGQHYAPNVRL